MTVYVVLYHDNSWGAQTSSDIVIGVYSDEDKANEIADTYTEKLQYDDDEISVISTDLDGEENLAYVNLKED